MVSATITPNEVVTEISPFVRIYKDGTIERPSDHPIVPPSPEDPRTGVSSKDIIFSQNPFISARLYLPKFTQSNHQIPRFPILVYFHGGAFCCESAFSQHHHLYLNLLVSQANIMAVSVEYRNAPEHFLPAAYDDCWAGLKWVASHSTHNPSNSDPWIINHSDFRKIFIGGDSSGGNIVHNIAMRAGTETLPGGAKIFGAYLNHPCFFGSKPFGFEPVTGFEQSFSHLLWNFVYPNAPGGLDNPMINPMAPGAPSLATLGCSKMLVTVAGKDHLRDRAVLYYETVKTSGWEGEVQLFEEEEEGHVYYMYDPDTENGNKMIKLLVDFLTQ